ncbi:hypothetical protein CTAYLR_002663 [Chrysophaeum taylorii]|uniref:FHA domain-containing protein n=1 Tax=Chrysophaeum taylorii TaxID=2483200 RepID=A0AAD7UCR4_9STRA|nr:hypothetical protein CTAYLR_002663 [Chrysophaeum taylorii]
MVEESAAHAYAKLQGKFLYAEEMDEEPAEVDAEIRHTTVRLGRAGEDADDFIALGTTKSMSRHHATIRWLSESDSWQISCLSKNGMVVDQAFYGKGETIELKHKSSE